MKKLYFIIPIVLLVIFVFFYLSARSSINAREAANAAQKEKDIEQRQQQEIASRKRAYDEAAAQANARIAEINAKNAEMARQKEEMQSYTDARDLAGRESQRLARQKGQLEDDLNVAKDQRQRAEQELKIQQTQIAYLRASAREIAQTRSAYEAALQKLNAAANAYLQQQQAAAAKKSN